MRIVIADTTPIRYLAEIEHLGLLPRLFTTVFIPAAVHEELQQPATPAVAREVVKSSSAAWLKIQPNTHSVDEPMFSALDEGEKAALMLYLQMGADLILMDERKGVAAARTKGIRTTGTLGVLILAAEHSLIDLADAFDRLRQTSFYCPESLLRKLLTDQQRKALS